MSEEPLNVESTKTLHNAKLDPSIDGRDVDLLADEMDARKTEFIKLEKKNRETLRLAKAMELLEKHPEKAASLYARAKGRYNSWMKHGRPAVSTKSGPSGMRKTKITRDWLKVNQPAADINFQDQRFGYATTLRSPLVDNTKVKRDGRWISKLKPFGARLRQMKSSLMSNLN